MSEKLLKAYERIQALIDAEKAKQEKFNFSDDRYWMSNTKIMALCDAALIVLEEARDHE